MVGNPQWERAAVLSLVVLTFAGCGGGTAGTAAPGSSDSAPGASAPSASAPGTSETGKLIVWTYYVVGGQIDAFNQQTKDIWEVKHPDVAIEHVQIPFDQLASKLLGTAVTQDGPDVVLDNVVVEFPTLASSGVLADMTGLWDSYADKSLFPESSVWKWEDKVYNLLSYTNLLGLYYNKDILDELGIAPPTTVSEFEAAMGKISSDGNYTPLAMSGVPSPEGAWMFMPFLLGEGINYCNLEVAPVQEAMTMFTRWADSKYIPRETATWDQADAWQAFFSGKYAFGINGNWNLGDVRSKATFTVGTTRLPAGSQGSHVFPGGEAIGIGSYSKNRDLAWDYITTTWLSKEASLINFKASGQIPTRSDLATDPAVASDALATPFVEAAAETSAWPLNSETAAMQNAVGAAFSALISGQKTAEQAAQEAVEGVKAAREKGGGSC